MLGFASSAQPTGFQGFRSDTIYWSREPPDRYQTGKVGGDGTHLGMAWIGVSRAAPKPLKIGLGEELLALTSVHPAMAELSRNPLRRALKGYTHAPAYRKALAKGGPRYDLAGQPTGQVTPEQQVIA